MTIRRRLFLSNMMMLVIPVALSMIFSYVILFVFSGRSEVPMEQAFPRVFEIILKFQRNENLDALYAGVDKFNADFIDNSVYMVIVRDDQLVYPENASELLSGNKPIFDFIFAEGVTGSITINHMRFVIEQAREYRVVMVDTQFEAGRGYGRPMVSQVLLVLGVMMVMIIATNRLLTHAITKRITTSLDRLANGAHQLKDGNLGYRIQYKGNDEFTPVYQSFNEMAVRLQKLIVRQQKDEESRKELLAGISHDLRTPLTSIKAYVEGLLDGVAEDFSAQLHYLSIIRNKAADIDQLVDKLFLFSKLDIDEYPFYHEKLNIGEELYSMARMEEDYKNRGLAVHLSEPPASLYVYADPVQLRNAFVNILENSLRYKDKETCTVKVLCFDGGQYVYVWMTDDGPGVPEKHLDKLFGVFYREDPSRHNPSTGSGLGLAITAKILDRMGGSIRAENAPGGGLRIVLELPKFADEGEGERE